MYVYTYMHICCIVLMDGKCVDVVPDCVCERQRERERECVCVCARVCYVNICIHEYIQACLCVSRLFVCSYLYLYVYPCVHRSIDTYHTHVWMCTRNYL